MVEIKVLKQVSPIGVRIMYSISNMETFECVVESVGIHFLVSNEFVLYTYSININTAKELV